MRAMIRAISSTLLALPSMFGRAQFARQQVPAAEHVERQIAVIVVIAVEEAPFLVPVQRVVGDAERLTERSAGEPEPPLRRVCAEVSVRGRGGKSG
jgi:hypothetical protein